MRASLPGTVSQVKTMARSVRVTFDSQEVLTPQQMSELFGLYEKVGYFIFHEAPVEAIDLATLPEIKPPPGEKSPSKRLRDRLFVYYTARNGKPEGFETWYADEMAKIGQRYLDAVN